MKRFTYKYIPALAAAVMGLMLAGCQQAAPPSVVSGNTPSSTSSTTEHSTAPTPKPSKPKHPPLTPTAAALLPLRGLRRRNNQPRLRRKNSNRGGRAAAQILTTRLPIVLAARLGCSACLVFL